MPEESNEYPGFYQVPNNNEIVINKSGVVIIKATGYRPVWQLSTNSKQHMVDYPNAQKTVKAAVSRILAWTFIPIPSHLQYCRNLLVCHQDDNNANLNLENLYWTTKTEVDQKRYEKKRTEYLSRNPLPYRDTSNDGLYPNAVECPEKPGFFYILLTDGLVVINNKGDLFNLVTNAAHSTHISHTGYVSTALRIDKQYVTLKVHRIVALLFCEKPERYKDKSFEELEVNHKDGVKTNAYCENLEWVTHLENMEHARQTGLVNDEIRVLGRNIYTDEITVFRSLSECSRLYFLDISSLYRHLNSFSAGRVATCNTVFKLDNGSEWPDLLYTLNGQVEDFKYICEILVEHASGVGVYLFSTLAEACEYLDLSISVVKNTRHRKGSDAIIAGQWIFKIL